MASDSSDDEEISAIGTGCFSEEAIDCSLQLVSHVFSEGRKERFLRKGSQGKPFLYRQPLFCKRGLTAMQKSLAAHFSRNPQFSFQHPNPFSAMSPPNPLPLSSDPDLLSLRPISCSELSSNTKHTGRILFGTICVEAFFLEGQMSALEEVGNPGAAIRLAIYNSERRYPPGTRVAIKEPHFKIPQLGIRVENPLAEMVEVASFPLRLELQGMEALRSRGNQCYRRGDCGNAAGLYTRCIERRPSGVAPGLLRECLIPAFSNRAAAFLETGEWEKALDDAGDALAMDERHLKSLFRKGRALEELKRFEEAEVWLELAKKELAKKELASAEDRVEIAAALERVKTRGTSIRDLD